MSKSPIFRLPEPQHYSDYGFDPQIDYFQVPSVDAPPCIVLLLILLLFSLFLIPTN